MKKITKILAVLVLLVFPVSSCATTKGAVKAKVDEAPKMSDAEVAENLAGIMEVFMGTLIQAGFGGADGKTLIFEMDEKNNKNTLTYNEYETAAIKSKLEEDGLNIPFDYITGTIVYTGSLMGEGIDGIKMDLKLKPGKVKTVLMDLQAPKDKNGKPSFNGSITINGQLYENLNEILQKAKEVDEKKNK